MSYPVHPTCFDASALVKLYVTEDGSEVLRAYWRTQATRYTTPFCFYETLSILKGKWRRGALTKEAYLGSVSQLVAWFRASDSLREDLNFIGDRDVFREAREIAEHEDLDLSDALQLLTLEAGYFSHFLGGSASLLVTADEPLAAVARKRGLSVWNCVRDPIAPR